MLRLLALFCGIFRLNYSGMQLVVYNAKWTSDKIKLGLWLIRNEVSMMQLRFNF